MRGAALVLATVLVLGVLGVEFVAGVARFSDDASSFLEVSNTPRKAKEAHKPKKSSSDPVNNPLYFPGKIYTKFFQGGHVQVRKRGYTRIVGRAKVSDGLKAGSITADEITADGFGVNYITSLTPGKPITLAGNLQVDGNVRFMAKAPSTTAQPRFRQTHTYRAIKQMNEDETRRQADLQERILQERADADDYRSATAFIETLSVISHENDADRSHRQWRLIAQDDFHEHTDGWFWSDGTPVEANRSHCNNFDHFLEARGQEEEPVLSVFKTFDTSAPHTQLELSARVHMIDSWHGSVMFAQIDDEYVWIDTHDSDPDSPDADLPVTAQSGVSLCGGPAPHDRMSIPVKVIVPHTAKNVTVLFGASSLSSFGSFGIDDVSLLAH